MTALMQKMIILFMLIIILIFSVDNRAGVPGETKEYVLGERNHAQRANN
jgi:hypothetical protein